MRPRVSGSGSKHLVLQFGPAPGSHGGMAAVLETYESLSLPGYEFEMVPTWRFDAKLWGAKYFLLALATFVIRLMRGDRAIVAHVHMADRGSVLREGAFVRLASRCKVPVVLSLHAGEFPDFYRRHPHLCAGVLHSADVVLCLGPRMAQWVTPLLSEGTELVIVPNPLPLNPSSLSTTPAGIQPPAALFAGLVCRRKGVDVLLQAWTQVQKEMPEARLLIAGPIIDVRIPDQVGVTPLGELTREEVWQEMARSRLVVLPSRAEVLPITLLEAMVHARPIVATPVGEVPQLLSGSGHTVAVEDVDGLASALLDLLARPQLATALGDAGARRAQDHYGWDTVVGQLVAAYETALDRRDARSERRTDVTTGRPLS